MHRCLSMTGLFLLAALLLHLPAENTVTAPKIIASPTYENIGVQIEFTGDDNKNASAAVTYRVVGAEAWRTAHACVRITYRKKKVVTKVFLATSLMFLAENTEYEIRAVLTDPDGVPQQPTSVKVRTKNSIVPTGAGKQWYVDPQAASGGDGSKERPFNSLEKGFSCGGPGDTVHLLPGEHRLHGLFKTTASGSAEKWLHYKAAPGTIITDADGDLSGVDKVKWTQFKQDAGKRWIYRAPIKDVERILVRMTPGDPKTGYMLYAYVPNAKGPHRGQNLQHLVDDFPAINHCGAFFQDKDAVYMVPPKNVDPATADIQITRKRGTLRFMSHHVLMEDVTFEMTATPTVYSHHDKNVAHHIFRRIEAYGLFKKAFFLGEHGLVEDSVFETKSFWNWFLSPPAKDGNVSWHKIKDSYNDTHGIRCLSHSVIRYCRFTRHSNAIPVNHSPWTPQDRHNFDVYGNELRFIGDDGIEPDGPSCNIRIYNNHMYDVHNGFSDGPVDYGPAFIVRNVFHRYQQGAIKIRNRASGHTFYYHNTCWPRTGGDAVPGSVDRDGKFSFGPDREGVQNMTTRNNIFVGRWEPYALRYKGYGTCNFDYNLLWATGDRKRHRILEEKHSIKKEPKFANLEKEDLRLAGPESPGVDAGIPIKGINDDVPAPYQYVGKAPDMGAFELGVELPRPGPR